MARTALSEPKRKGEFYAVVKSSVIFWDKIVQPQRVVRSQANVTFDHFQIFGTLHFEFGVFNLYHVYRNDKKKMCSLI